MRMDDSISRQAAIKTVRKTILSLMDGLPTINIDGEEYCADNRLHNAYLETNKAVNNALRKLPSWHIEDPAADVVKVSKVRQVLLAEFGKEEEEAIDALMERMK